MFFLKKYKFFNQINKSSLVNFFWKINLSKKEQPIRFLLKWLSFKYNFVTPLFVDVFSKKTESLLFTNTFFTYLPSLIISRLLIDSRI